ncbi:MAG TPA: response regulator [Steroidobacteraceae bacterium]|nr:response regulator [Steroidobacteraceae bacterium]
MIPGKRALVVDDSRSARVVLSRMLERYGILVDSAESAEAALEYLKNGRPDVIFMDHLMPGMDGLTAVREIKANPELSTIPIMMYTSQEGEIYSGQARASGAVGVLPKSIRPIDVTKALYQLQLLPDRRDGEPSALESIGGPPPRDGVSAESAAAMQPVEALLKEQNLELRRFIVSTMDAWTHRVVAELRPKDPAIAGEDAAAAPKAGSRTWPWVLATASAVAALAVVGFLYWQARVTAEQAERAFQAVTASNETLTKAIEKWRIAGEAASDSAGQAGFRPLVLAVPFGEQALNPSRLESVRTLVAQLERAAISGVVRIESFNGSFCLASAGQDGYTLEAPTAPASQCDQVGNPFADSMTPASRQPIAFANLASSVRQRTGGAIALELAAGPRDRLAVAYPPIEQATAGQWNAAAQSNNRIEISIVER